MLRHWILITVLAVSGLLMLIAGYVIRKVLPPIIKDKVSEAVVLVNGSAKYDSWLNSPAPVYVEFYFYNLTNRDEVLLDSAKPNVTQIGPFTYRKLREKTFVQFSKDGTFIEYKENTSYVFEREKSAGPEDTWFMGVNLPMLTMAYVLEPKLSWYQLFAFTGLMGAKGVHLFQNYTVKEYLWGYTDEFFISVKSWLNKLGYDSMASMVPETVGLFVGDKSNGSNDGLWRIDTGKENVSDVNKIISWKGNSSLDYWNSDWANMINGTDASTFHPFVQRDEELPMFTTSLCRSGSFTYQKDIVNKGLNLYRFTLKKDLLESVENNPDNADFCTPPGNCLPKGVLNISNCAGGAPIILSQPHFYGADKVFVNAIDGIKPTPDLQTMLDIDPMTGAVLQGRKLIQYNAYISELGTFSDTLQMNTTVFPVLWVNETGGITDDGAERFWNAVYAPGVYVYVTSYVLLGVGCCTLVIVIFLCICIKVREVCKGDRTVEFKNDNKRKKQIERDPSTQISLIQSPSTGYVPYVKSDINGIIITEKPLINGVVTSDNQQSNGVVTNGYTFSNGYRRPSLVIRPLTRKDSVV